MRKASLLPERYVVCWYGSAWRIEAEYADGLRITACIIPDAFPRAAERADALAKTLNDYGGAVSYSLSDIAAVLQECEQQRAASSP